MRAPALVALTALAAMLAACGDSGGQPGTSDSENPVIAPPLNQGALPLQASDFAELASRDCGTIAQFYFDSIAQAEFERAALVWNDPVIDGARLEALFSAYAAPRFAPSPPTEEGAAGSLYCTVSATLDDTAGEGPTETGQLTLRRVNEVPGAMRDQLRWTIRSSTFVEPMERSRTGEP